VWVCVCQGPVVDVVERDVRGGVFPSAAVQRVISVGAWAGVCVGVCVCVCGGGGVWCWCAGRGLPVRKWCVCVCVCLSRPSISVPTLEEILSVCGCTSVGCPSTLSIVSLLPNYSSFWFSGGPVPASLGFVTSLRTLYARVLFPRVRAGCESAWSVCVSLIGVCFCVVLCRVSDVSGRNMSGLLPGSLGQLTALTAL
jgi:hypothetical protein